MSIPVIENTNRSRRCDIKSLEAAILLTVLLLVLMLLSLVSHSGSAWSQTLHRGLGPAPDSLDIHAAQSLSALNVLRDLHEGLLTVAADGTLIPGLARSWTVSEDGRVWQFELDAEARWSDGEAITAADVLAGWQRLLDPATASPNAAWLDMIENAPTVRAGSVPDRQLGVSIDEPHRLIVRLARATPWFPELLTHPATFPWPGEKIDRYSGAFVLAEQVPGAHFRLQPNPLYREADQVELTEVVWHVIEEAVVEMNRYRAGELHITETIPPGRLDWLREQFGEELRIAPYLGSFFLAFNVAREPFVDQPGLRRALSLVIDRELLADRVLGAGEIPAWHLIPPGMPGWPENEERPHASREARLAEARELYAQAGYSKRRPLTTELRFNSSLSHRRMAAAVAAMWREQLGVRTRMINEEWKVFVANRRHGRLTQVMRGGWIADWRDPANFLQLFVSDSPLNYTFWQDARFDQLMEHAEQMTGDTRLDWLRQAEIRLLEQQVIVPLYYYVSRHLIKPDVKGFENNLMDIHLSRWLSLE